MLEAGAPRAPANSVPRFFEFGAMFLYRLRALVHCTREITQLADASARKVRSTASQFTGDKSVPPWRAPAVGLRRA